MDDVGSFSAVLSPHRGIDIERLMARAQQDDVKKRLIDLTTDAVNRGAFGSPTFFCRQGNVFRQGFQLRGCPRIRSSSRPAARMPGKTA